MQSIIERVGHAIQYVSGGPGEFSWAYTIGLARIGRPELIATGVSPADASAMFNEIVQDWDRMEIAFDGLCTLPGRGNQCRFAEVPETVWQSDYLVGAKRDAAEQGVSLPVAVQVLWADQTRQFPDDPSAPPSFRRAQPILSKLLNTRHQ